MKAKQISQGTVVDRDYDISFLSVFLSRKIKRHLKF
jgi:hypothetical protein